MVPDEAQGAVNSIGHELVSRLAPEELPLYQALAGQPGSSKGSRGQASSDDRILGFGTGETIALLTPMILEFARAFWDALAAQAADASIRDLLARRHRDHQAVPALTPAQLERVRKVAEQQARRLSLPDGQAGLLADALVGVLAAPPASAAPSGRHDPDH